MVSTATLEDADDFGITLCDGLQYPWKPSAAGWGRAQRLPQHLSTVAQLEFVVEAHSVGTAYPMLKLSPADARRVMEGLGLQEVARRFSKIPYFRDHGKATFNRNQLLEESQSASYFGKAQPLLQGQLDRARKKGAVVERYDEDEDQLSGEPARKKRKRKQGGASAEASAEGAAGTAGEAGAVGAQPGAKRAKGEPAWKKPVAKHTAVCALGGALAGSGFGQGAADAFQAEMEAAGLPVTAERLSKAVITEVTAWRAASKKRASCPKSRA